MDFNKSFTHQRLSSTNGSSPTNESTLTASTGHSPLSESSEFKSAKLFLYFVILIFSSAGNGLVFHLIACNRRLRQASSNMLLLNLSACDFFTPLLSIPFDLVLEERGYVWPYGAFMCRVLWPASTLTATASALTLAAISLDRFRLLMHPFTLRLTKTQIKFIIISIHLLSLSIIVPYINFLNLEDQECHEQWPKLGYRQAYTVVLFMAQYALPLVFMTAVYGLALSKLYSVTSNATHMRCMDNQNSRRLSASSPPRKVSVSSPPRNVSISSPTREVSFSSSTWEVSVSSPTREISVSSPTRKVSVSSPPRKVSISSPTWEVSVSCPPREISVSSPTREISVSSPTREVSVSSRPRKGSVSSPSRKLSSSSPPRKISVCSRKISASSQFAETNNSPAEVKRGAIRKLSARLTYNMRHGFELESNVRVTKMFIAIVVIFAIFMLPNQVVWLWTDFGGGQHHSRLNTIKIICWLFTYTNCVCNPVIFVSFCKDFRAEVLTLPKKVWKRPSQSSFKSISRSNGPVTDYRQFPSRTPPLTSLSTLVENEK